MFNTEDLQQISSKGVSIHVIEEQLRNFREGYPYLDILRPATPGDGIIEVFSYEEDQIIESFEKNKSGLSILKFVPASGAASRMFKALFEFDQKFNSLEETLERKALINKYPEVKEVFDKLALFAFNDDLEIILEKEC